MLAFPSGPGLNTAEPGGDVTHHGVRTFIQFEDNLAALSVDFTEEQIARLNAASSVEPCFPHNIIYTPTGDMMLGNMKVAKRSHHG